MISNFLQRRLVPSGPSDASSELVDETANDDSNRFLDLMIRGFFLPPLFLKQPSSPSDGSSGPSHQPWRPQWTPPSPRFHKHRQNNITNIVLPTAAPAPAPTPTTATASRTASVSASTPTTPFETTRSFSGSLSERGIIKVIHSPVLRWDTGVPRSCVQLIDEETKARLFRGALPVSAADDARAIRTLDRLRRLSADAACSFEPKHGELEDLTLRLIFPKAEHRAWVARAPAHKRVRRDDELRGYYALSYRWRSAVADEVRVTNSAINSKSNSANSSFQYTKEQELALLEQQDQEPETQRSANPTWASMNSSSSSSKGCPRRQRSLKKDDHAAAESDMAMMLPTSEAMFIAVMDELPHADGRWGLWCDQICIDEADEDERNKSVAMMDAIYRAAAKVVIALDDIEIQDPEEVDALLEFEEWHDRLSGEGLIPEDEDLKYLKKRPKLRACVERIIYSEYFDRAWCAHEFELANDRIVLIRAGPSTGGEQRIVRICNDKLHTLMLLLSMDTKASISPEQARHRVNVELLIARSDRDDPFTRAQNVHDMQTLSLINSMQAGGDPTLPEELRYYSAIRDKVSIFLNACQHNLQPVQGLDIAELSTHLASSRMYQRVSLLMLATGNPLVLATTGKPLMADDTHESWLRKFWLLDAGIDAAVPPLKHPINVTVDPSPHCCWIKLDLLFPVCGGHLNTASEKYLAAAEKFVRDYRKSHKDQSFQTDLEVLEMRLDHVTHLIACILETRRCWQEGATPWMKRFGGERKQWKYFFGDALDQLPAQLQGPGRSSPRTSPRRLSDAAEKGRRRGSSANRFGKPVQEQGTAVEEAGKLMNSLLMTAPLPQSRGDAATWRPTWFEIGKNGARYIAMAPREEGKYRVAVPALLKTADYAELARCWILEEKEDASSDHWIVRNRSKMMMEGDTLEPEITQGAWYCEEQQTVWGRKIEPAS